MRRIALIAVLSLTGCAQAGQAPEPTAATTSAAASPSATPNPTSTPTTPATPTPTPEETTVTITAPEPEEFLQAAADGDLAVVEQAIEAGADLEARDEEQRTALLLAATNDHVDVARALIDAGASPDAVDAQHDTPWLVTGVTGSVEMAEVLLAGEPDQTLKNRYGGISIIPASERGHVDYVREVVTLDGVDVNHVNNLGWTALLEAVILGDGSEPYQEIVKILLAAGADAGIGDKDGVTAIEHAERKGYTEIVLLLNNK